MPRIHVQHWCNWNVAIVGSHSHLQHDKQGSLFPSVYKRPFWKTKGTKTTKWIDALPSAFTLWYFFWYFVMRYLGCAKLFSYWIVRNYREAYNFYGVNGILFSHESHRRGQQFVTRKITMAVARIRKNVQTCLYLGNLDSKRDWGHAKVCHFLLCLHGYRTM